MDRSVKELIPSGHDLLALAGLALITGVFVSLPVFILALVLDAGHPFQLALVTLATVQALVWLVVIRRWSGLLNVLETSLQLDLDHNGKIGNEDPGQPVRVEVIEDEGTRGTYASLPATQGQLVTLARGILQERKTLADQVWTGQGRPFDRRTFTQLKGELLSRGLATWNSPGCSARGLSLTRTGQAVFRYFLTVDAPTLSGDKYRDRD